jgi:hypothetical protein
MPETLDYDEEDRRYYISDEIRCSWTHRWWGTCIRNPRHRGRPHMVIGLGQVEFDNNEKMVRYLEQGDLIEVPPYTRKTPLGRDFG